MMNMPSSTDPYASATPPLFPFASLDPSTSNSSPDNHPLWYLDSTTTAHTSSNNDPYLATNSSYLDCPQPLLPIPSFSFHAQEERGKIGLNLGQRTYFSSENAMAIDRLHMGRAHQPPRCQVEGCMADLFGAKHYHRRHRVCEFHSKATVVIAGGVQQRFCQQCSRFHVLSEFDEAKRSCRKRLAEHNRRRRKPHPSMDSSASKNSTTATTTDSKDKSQHTRHNTKDLTSKSSTSAAAAACATSISNARVSLDGQQGNQNKGTQMRNGPSLDGQNQNKGTQMRNGPALSLGGVERGAMWPQGLYQGFSSHSSSSNSFFHHHDLFCSEASQSKAGASDSTQSHQQSNNLLHLGQAMFEVDFM